MLLTIASREGPWNFLKCVIYSNKILSLSTSMFMCDLMSIRDPLGTRLVVSVRGDEPYEELEILKGVDATMLLHDLPYTEDDVSRVHAARR